MGTKLPTIVYLTEQETKYADQVGQWRWTEALRQGCHDSHGLQSDSPAEHLLGTRGELAFSKVSGLPWDGSVNTFKSKPDVACFEVRTRSKPWHELIVRDDDFSSRDFALMCLQKDGGYAFHGWIPGYSAKQERYRASHGGRESAYFVPQTALVGLWPAQ